MQEETRFIETPPGYSFNKTCDFAFSSKRISSNNNFSTSIYDSISYKKVIKSNNGLFLSEVTAAKDNSLQVRITGDNLSDTNIQKTIKTLSRILGLNQNPSQFYDIYKSDPIIGPLINKYTGLHIPQSNSIFEGLVTAIIGQQINTSVANMLRSLLIEKYGESIKINGNLFYVFPTPEKIMSVGIEELHKNKFSSRKAEYIWGIAKSICTNELNVDMLAKSPYEKAMKDLVDLRGVGTWTAQWLMINSLGFEDGFPSGDLALQKILTEKLERKPLMSDDQILNYSNIWSPYRSWATIYLFADIRNTL